MNFTRMNSLMPVCENALKRHHWGTDFLRRCDVVVLTRRKMTIPWMRTNEKRVTERTHPGYCHFPARQNHDVAAPQKIVPPMMALQSVFANGHKRIHPLKFIENVFLLMARRKLISLNCID